MRIIRSYIEIERAIRENMLMLDMFGPEETQTLVGRLYRTFVDGDPRALWLGLKYTPERIGSPERDPYWRLPDVFEAERTLYLFIDLDNVEFVVLRGHFSDIHRLIGDCEAIDEYYLVSPEFQELWCATDHDELLYVSSPPAETLRTGTHEPCVPV